MLGTTNARLYVYVRSVTVTDANKTLYRRVTENTQCPNTPLILLHSHHYTHTFTRYILSLSLSLFFSCHFLFSLISYFFIQLFSQLLSRNYTNIDRFINPFLRTHNFIQILASLIERIIPFLGKPVHCSRLQIVHDHHWCLIIMKFSRLI